MPGQFEGTTEIDRPIAEVFAFLAAGVNDQKFSPRVQKIEKTTDGPVGVGTVFASTVKDAGMTTTRAFRITEFEEPTTLRWAEQSKNLVTVLAGHGFGKLIAGFALKAAQKDAPAFAGRIKAAVEAS